MSILPFPNSDETSGPKSAPKSATTGGVSVLASEIGCLLQRTVPFFRNDTDAAMQALISCAEALVIPPGAAAAAAASPVVVSGSGTGQRGGGGCRGGKTSAPPAVAVAPPTSAISDAPVAPTVAKEFSIDPPLMAFFDPAHHAKRAAFRVRRRGRLVVLTCDESPAAIAAGTNASASNNKSNALEDDSAAACDDAAAMKAVAEHVLASAAMPRATDLPLESLSSSSSFDVAASAVTLTTAAGDNNAAATSQRQYDEEDPRTDEELFAPGLPDAVQAALHCIRLRRSPYADANSSGSVPLTPTDPPVYLRVLNWQFPGLSLYLAVTERMLHAVVERSHTALAILFSTAPFPSAGDKGAQACTATGRCPTGIASAAGSPSNAASLPSVKCLSPYDSEATVAERPILSRRDAVDVWVDAALRCSPNVTIAFASGAAVIMPCGGDTTTAVHHGDLSANVLASTELQPDASNALQWLLSTCKRDDGIFCVSTSSGGEPNTTSQQSLRRSISVVDITDPLAAPSTFNRAASHACLAAATALMDVNLPTTVTLRTTAFSPSTPKCVAGGGPISIPRSMMAQIVEDHVQAALLLERAATHASAALLTAGTPFDTAMDTAVILEALRLSPAAARSALDRGPCEDSADAADPIDFVAPSAERLCALLGVAGIANIPASASPLNAVGLHLCTGTMYVTAQVAEATIRRLHTLDPQSRTPNGLVGDVLIAVTALMRLQGQFGLFANAVVASGYTAPPLPSPLPPGGEAAALTQGDSQQRSDRTAAADASAKKGKGGSSRSAAVSGDKKIQHGEATIETAAATSGGVKGEDLISSIAMRSPVAATVRGLVADLAAACMLCPGLYPLVRMALERLHGLAPSSTAGTALTPFTTTFTHPSFDFDRLSYVALKLYGSASVAPAPPPPSPPATAASADAAAAAATSAAPNPLAAVEMALKAVTPPPFPAPPAPAVALRLGQIQYLVGQRHLTSGRYTKAQESLARADHLIASAADAPDLDRRAVQVTEVEVAVALGDLCRRRAEAERDAALLAGISGREDTLWCDAIAAYRRAVQKEEAILKRRPPPPSPSVVAAAAAADASTAAAIAAANAAGCTRSKNINRRWDAIAAVHQQRRAHLGLTLILYAARLVHTMSAVPDGASNMAYLFSLRAIRDTIAAGGLSAGGPGAQFLYALMSRPATGPSVHPYIIDVVRHIEDLLASAAPFLPHGSQARQRELAERLRLYVAAIRTGYLPPSVAALIHHGPNSVGPEVPLMVQLRAAALYYVNRGWRLLNARWLSVAPVASGHHHHHSSGGGGAFTAASGGGGGNPGGTKAAHGGSTAAAAGSGGSGGAGGAAPGNWLHALQETLRPQPSELESLCVMFYTTILEMDLTRERCTEDLASGHIETVVELVRAVELAAHPERVMPHVPPPGTPGSAAAAKAAAAVGLVVKPEYADKLPAQLPPTATMEEKENQRRLLQSPVLSGLPTRAAALGGLIGGALALPDAVLLQPALQQLLLHAVEPLDSPLIRCFYCDFDRTAAAAAEIASGTATSAAGGCDAAAEKKQATPSSTHNSTDAAVTTELPLPLLARLARFFTALLSESTNTVKRLHDAAAAHAARHLQHSIDAAADEAAAAEAASVSAPTSTSRGDSVEQTAAGGEAASVGTRGSAAASTFTDEAAVRAALRAHAAELRLQLFFLGRQLQHMIG